MDLSNDLISQFVKITNDNKTNSKEATVYGTTVEYNGEIYVKIDGSDLLTPVDTTADIGDNERVTIMIKDHNATVTGNITSPSANATTVGKKVTEAVEGIEGKVITEVEILIADRVSTEQLDAELARIDVLVAGMATIEQLEAIDAKIDNLEVGDLTAVYAKIEELIAENLEATNADIESLTAEVGRISTLINGNLTSDNILAFHITADKVTMEDAFIKDAMIDDISAGKITSGSINTNLVNIQSEDGSMTINGSTQQFRDNEGNVRIQIGKDATGDFTFALYGADGQGQLINQNGITASGIGNGIIVDNMISDNAGISGGKLDISSVISEINSDTSETIKSNKIYLDEQEQSLEVAFNSLKTKVDMFEDVTIDGDLSGIVNQVTTNATEIEVCKNRINTLVLEDNVIKESITDLNGDLVEFNTTLTSKYANLEQTIDGFKTQVVDSYATKNELTNEMSKVESSMTTVTQTANKINWLVESGTSSSNMSLTNEAYELISDNINLTADRINLHGYITANGGFSIDEHGNMTAVDGTFSGTVKGSELDGNTIVGGTININDNFFVSSAGALTTNSTIMAQGGLYTYQDIRGLDATEKTGGLTLVTGTGHIVVRCESEQYGVYLQPASGVAYVTYPSSPNLADLHLRNLKGTQVDATYGNFALAQLTGNNAYMEFASGHGIVRVVDNTHLYLQCGNTAGNTNSEVRCTCYKDPNRYANVRAHNVCAQNAVFANGVNVTSDINKKRDIEIYKADALHEICTTPVYAYHLDTDLDAEIKRIGIIMQEAPLDAIDLSGKGVDLYQMVTMLWRAVQQQQEMINNINSK